MANDTKKWSYEEGTGSKRRASRVFGLGLVSAVSQVAGGLAVAWWYRNTITKLQNPIAHLEAATPEFSEAEEDIPPQAMLSTRGRNTQDH
jgi:hypothetical protein